MQHVRTKKDRKNDNFPINRYRENSKYCQIANSKKSVRENHVDPNFSEVDSNLVTLNFAQK